MSSVGTNVHVDKKESIRVRHNTLKVDLGDGGAKRIVETLVIGTGTDANEVTFYCNREQWLEFVREMNKVYLETFPLDIVIPSALTPNKRLPKKAKVARVATV